MRERRQRGIRSSPEEAPRHIPSVVSNVRVVRDQRLLIEISQSVLKSGEMC